MRELCAIISTADYSVVCLSSLQFYVVWKQQNERLIRMD